jgi:hypothetical protein
MRGLESYEKKCFEDGGFVGQELSKIETYTYRTYAVTIISAVVSLLAIAAQIINRYLL